METMDVEIQELAVTPAESKVLLAVLQLLRSNQTAHQSDIGAPCQLTPLATSKNTQH